MTETLVLSWHIVRRNWTVYRKDLIANTSPTLSDPIFMIFSLGLGLGAAVNSLEGKSYLEYLAPGLAAITALLTSFFESSYGFYVRMTFENIFKALLTTPVGVREIIFGEYIWVGLKGAGMSTGVSIVLALFGTIDSLWIAFLIPFVGFFIALGCGALGLISSALVHNINQFQTVYAWLISPLFYFSGIFFPIEHMPYIAQVLTWFFPLSHGVKLFQMIYWNEWTWTLFFQHGGALVVQGLILGAIGYRATAKRLRP